MTDPTTQVIREDRGLGTAYERYCFYQLLDSIASEYQVESALEGPLDGMAGISGVHLAGLARRGIQVSSFLPHADKVAIADNVYRGVAPSVSASVRVAGIEDLQTLPRSDLVLSYHALSFVNDWKRYLHDVGQLARKVLVVTVCNPGNWGVAAVRLAARLRGKRLEAPESWQTDVLLPELWRIGRVRKHLYFDAPWWPDLQVAPGQTLQDRARQLLGSRGGALQFTASPDSAKLAERFVYHGAHWPYFGGPGWHDELMPALLRHPGFDGRQGAAMKYLSHLHAFVVEIRHRKSPGLGMAPSTD
jgi:hypothetical protein